MKCFLLHSHWRRDKEWGTEMRRECKSWVIGWKWKTGTSENVNRCHRPYENFHINWFVSFASVGLNRLFFLSFFLKRTSWRYRCWRYGFPINNFAVTFITIKRRKQSGRKSRLMANRSTFFDAFLFWSLFWFFFRKKKILADMESLLKAISILAQLFDGEIWLGDCLKTILRP